MKKLLLIYLIFNSLLVFSQKNKKTEAILDEGKLLFRLEKGSWYGTDDMLARFKTKKDSVGGYLSYENSKNRINTIFFSRFNSNHILIRYEFDSLPQQKPILIDTLNKKTTEIEKSLIKIRQDARDKASDNSDNFFTYYDNSSLNFIPIIKNNKGKVFVITGPQVSGVVLIGNDYILNYNSKNEFVDKSKIHNSILQFAYKSENKDNPTVSTIHSHVITDYISSTDICTLLLYKDYVEWKQHIVTSDKEVSIFDLEKETLFAMKRKAWEKIYNSEKSKK